MPVTHGPIFVGILLVICGLVMVALSGRAKFALLCAVIFWLGIVIAAVGAVLLVTPPLEWLNRTLCDAMGVRR